MTKYLNRIDILHGTNPHEVNPIFNTLCTQLSLDVAKVCREAGSGHLGGSLSSVELMSTLYLGGHLQFSKENPRDPDRDRILLRGHLGPLRYPLFSMLDWVDREELHHYRRLNSPLHGHETMQDVPGVDITPSGSLGMVLSYGIGASIVSNKAAHQFKTYVFLGDGEEQEGNVSEAARHAANLKLNNLVCILDKNGKQLSRPTNDMNSNSDVATIWRGYGWNVINLEEGHNPLKISEAYDQANQYKSGPTLIIAHTHKGHGLYEADRHFCGYHTISNCTPEIVDAFIAEKKQELADSGYSLEDIKQAINANIQNVAIKEAEKKSEIFYDNIDSEDVKDWHQHDSVTHYYQKLTKNVKKNNIHNFYFLTADLMPKDAMQWCHLDQLENYFDVGLREQHMYAMAHGISVTDPTARIHINATEAFTYRGLDQFNVVGQGGSRIIVTADKAGISNARNGSTHQSVAQPFAVLHQPNTTFLEPSDVEDFYSCLNVSFRNNDSVYYIRSHSLDCPNLPKRDFVKDEINPFFEIGDPVEHPDVTLVGSGITTAYLWDAMDELKENGITARLINVTAPGMLGEGFAKSIENDKPCFCLYNGHPDFLPSVVSQAIVQNPHGRPSMIKGHGFTMGNSGTIDELKAYFGYDRASIVKNVTEIHREHEMRQKLKGYQEKQDKNDVTKAILSKNIADRINNIK